MRVGRVLGAVGSTIFHTLTQLAGRRGTSDRVWTNWYSTGEGYPGSTGRWFQILKLAYMRETLFANNLVRTYPEGAKTAYCTATEPPAWARRWRTADGSWNDLRPDADGRIDPMVGAAYTRFFRNLGDDRGLAAVHPRPNPAANPVSVREVSRKLLAPKGPRVEFPYLNLWAAAWIQFQNNDWISHGSNDAGDIDFIPLAEDDPLRAYGVDQLPVRATCADPTRRAEDDGLPPTFLNEVTHWWDGSQIYGSDWKTQHQVRAMERGHLTVTEDGLLPVDEETGSEATGFMRNWWVGLGLLHTLFTREHNAIVDMLAKAYPSWDDEALFQTARLINVATTARIHTLEWTPAILPNQTLLEALLTNWFGLVTTSSVASAGRCSKTSRSRAASSVGSSATSKVSARATASPRSSRASTACTRCCPTRSTSATSTATRRRRTRWPARDRRRHRSCSPRTASRRWRGSFGEQHPFQLINNNYPRTLMNFSAPEMPLVDMGSIDIYRDRERGVPTYNQLRREMGLNPVPSFDDLTDDAETVATLREVYGVDLSGRDRIDDMDLLVGTLSEGHRPSGFGFGETLFQIFIMNASLRLLADRFFTIDYREDVYTPEGLAWVDTTLFKDVLLRHIPELAQTGLANVSNAFEPWDMGRLAPERHPLRAFDESLDDPWAGDAPTR